MSAGIGMGELLIIMCIGVTLLALITGAVVIPLMIMAGKKKQPPPD